MSNLSCFFAQNKIKKANLKFVASKNFVDKDGNPIEWEIRELTNKEVEEIKKECTIKTKQRNNMYTTDLDSDKFSGKLAARSTVYPDLHNVELQNSYGVMGEDDLLKAMLSFGEYAEYQLKVTEHNDLDKTLDDKVEEAKN